MFTIKKKFKLYRFFSNYDKKRVWPVSKGFLLLLGTWSYLYLFGGLCCSALNLHFFFSWLAVCFCHFIFNSIKRNRRRDIQVDISNAYKRMYVSFDITGLKYDILAHFGFTIQLLGLCFVLFISLHRVQLFDPLLFGQTIDK